MRFIGSTVVLLATVSISMAAVNVDVRTPGATVHVGTPPPLPPLPQVIVVDPGRPSNDYKHDNGKHKGQKKHKKHKKEKHEDRGEHRGEGHHK